MFLPRPDHQILRRLNSENEPHAGTMTLIQERTSMLNELRFKFARFMQGRYGMDQFSRFLSVVLLILIAANFFLRIRAIGLLCWAVLFYMYFRIFSRNIPKRYGENRKFLALQSRVTGFFRNFRHGASQARDYHIYKCPQCAQKIRIPRGKGKIIVRCPKCGHEFQKRS